MSYQTLKGTIKKGAPFKVSVRGHNNFFYPGEEIFHTQKDIAYSSVSGWLSFDGLKPVKISSNDISTTLQKTIIEKYSVIWITI